MSGTITHSWHGTVLTVTSDSGTSSADLKGEKGDTGIRGAQGVAGYSNLPLDAGLTVAGAAADAKAVGDALAALAESGGSGGGVALTLLWENAATYSEFSAQSIPISALDNYDLLYIEFFGDIYNDNNLHSFICPVFYNDYEEYANMSLKVPYRDYDYNVCIGMRRFSTWAESGYIYFEDCTCDFGGGSPYTDNGVAIPYKVFGIEGVTRP